MEGHPWDPLMKADGKRWMTADEVLERQELNVANTATALRRRVEQETARANGATPPSG
jgi:hypothetical protein